ALKPDCVRYIACSNAADGRPCSNSHGPRFRYSTICFTSTSQDCFRESETPCLGRASLINTCLIPCSHFPIKKHWPRICVRLVFRMSDTTICLAVLPVYTSEINKNKIADAPGQGILAPSRLPPQ